MSQNKSPLVSIIITTFNRAHLINEILYSCFQYFRALILLKKESLVVEIMNNENKIMLSIQLMN